LTCLAARVLIFFEKLKRKISQRRRSSVGLEAKASVSTATTKVCPFFGIKRSRAVQPESTGLKNAVGGSRKGESYLLADSGSNQVVVTGDDLQ